MDTTYDIITIYNPDTNPFTIVYDNKTYGVINPGEQRRLPRFLAKLAVKHLIDQCLNTAQMATNNVEQREIWAKKIVVNEESQDLMPIDTPEQKLQKEIDELNRSSDLDKVLSSAKAQVSDAPPTPATPPSFSPNPIQSISTPPAPAPTSQVSTEPQNAPLPPKSEPPKDLGVTPPTGESAVLPEVDNTEAAAGTPPPVAPPVVNGKAEVTRESLYKYATDTLGMTLNDEKTKATLDAMDLPKLAETLGYDLNTNAATV